MATRAAASLAGYLEAMSRPVFATGMSWKVVEVEVGRHPRRLSDFEPERVAAMTPADVERLRHRPGDDPQPQKDRGHDPQRERILELDREHRGFDRYLATHGSFEQTVADAAARLQLSG